MGELKCKAPACMFWMSRGAQTHLSHIPSLSPDASQALANCSSPAQRAISQLCALLLREVLLQGKFRSGSQSPLKCHCH